MIWYIAIASQRLRRRGNWPALCFTLLSQTYFVPFCISTCKLPVPSCHSPFVRSTGQNGEANNNGCLISQQPECALFFHTCLPIGVCCRSRAPSCNRDQRETTLVTKKAMIISQLTTRASSRRKASPEVSKERRRGMAEPVCTLAPFVAMLFPLLHTLLPRHSLLENYCSYLSTRYNERYGRC